MSHALASAPLEPRTGPVGGALDAVEETAAALHRRLRGAWGRTPSVVGVLAGAMLVVAGVFSGVAVGAPVLGHGAQPLVILAALAGGGGGALWLAKAWRAAPPALRRSAAGVAMVLVSTFTVGTLTNPVVVDGQVYLATSPQARSFTLIQDVRQDLLELAQVDAYLTFDAAEAGAHYDDYTPLLDRMTVLSNEYAELASDSGAWPDARFETVLSQTKAASYWAARSVESKVQVIDEDNAKSQADLSSNRAAFAESVIAAGTSLRELAAEMDLPLTKMGPTE